MENFSTVSYDVAAGDLLFAASKHNDRTCCVRTAFLFPGQGSQRPGMASAWLPGADAQFAAFATATGLDLPAVADDDVACARTATAQPALFATSLAAFDALTDAGIRPDVVAGHSLGEATAAAASGVLARTDGAAFVAERGRAMGLACRRSPGVMAAVLRLPADTIDLALSAFPDLHVANLNAPGQTVIAGPAAALERAIPRLEDAGGRVRRLSVEGAFHSPAMAPAMVAADAFLRRVPLADPAVPIVTGVSGDVLTSAAEVRNALVAGILAPVRWVDVQRQLANLEIDVAVEVGSAGVLAAMARRTIPDLTVIPIASPQDVADLVDALEDKDRSELFNTSLVA